MNSNRMQISKWLVCFIAMSMIMANLSIAEESMDLSKVEKQKPKENWVKSNFGKYYHDVNNYAYDETTNTIRMWVKTNLKNKKSERYEVVCDLIPNGIKGKYRKISEKTGSNITNIESNWKSIVSNDIGANICKDGKYN